MPDSPKRRPPRKKKQPQTRKPARQQLMESEACLLTEGSALLFLYRHDFDHRFQYLSPSVQNVLGYQPGELVGRQHENQHFGVALGW